MCFFPEHIRPLASDHLKYLHKTPTYFIFLLEVSLDNLLNMPVYGYAGLTVQPVKESDFWIGQFE